MDDMCISHLLSWKSHFDPYLLEFGFFFFFFAKTIA